MTSRFFALAFAITWTLQLPAVLAGASFMPLAGLGAFGPLIATVLVARREPGGVRRLFAPLRTWRVHPLWYAVALGLPALVYAVGAAVHNAFGGDVPLVWPPENGQRIAAMIVFPIGEELGWRGLALPRLQQRHTPLTASLIVGLGWALWHLPMFYLAGMSITVVAIACLSLLAGSVMFTWLFNRTRGSLLLAVLLHAGAHLSNPNQALPADAAPLAIDTAALCVLAIVLVLAGQLKSPLRPA